MKELLGIKALSEDELEMVVGGSSIGVNYSVEVAAAIAQCQDETVQQLDQCMLTCQYADDKQDCAKGCDNDYWDSMEACEPMPEP